MTLTEFLQARYAEEEKVARDTLTAFEPLDWGDEPGRFDAWHMLGPVDGPSGYASIVVDPARVLAECEAKQALLKVHRPHLVEWDDTHDDGGVFARGYECQCCGGFWPTAEQVECYSLHILALPYAGHADYQPHWRP